MKIIARLIDQMAAFCIRQYWHYFSRRQFIAQPEDPTRLFIEEEKKSAGSPPSGEAQLG